MQVITINIAKYKLFLVRYKYMTHNNNQYY